MLAALASLRLFGRDGLRATLGHLVEMTQVLREHLEGHEGITILNRDNYGVVTLFRSYPPGVDTFAIKQQEMEDPEFGDVVDAHNEHNRKLYDLVHKEALSGKGVMISLTDCYRYAASGKPIVALKSFLLTPFVDEEHVEVLVKMVLEARNKLNAS